jgi:hypothetical protein
LVGAERTRLSASLEEAMKNIDSEERAFRGGSWRGASTYCRASYRGRGTPGHRSIYLGFRVVLSPPQDRISLPSSVLPSNGFPLSSSSGQ